jgi:hypothetical protein
MNKLLIAVIFSIFIFHHDINCASSKQYSPSSLISCAPELQKSFKEIQKIPEAKALITSILREGPIRIIAQNTDLSSRFGAYWDPDSRIICVATSKDISEASIIGSILFELHNASTNAKINHFDKLAIQRQITKANYVESMEYIEYINSINTAALTEKGIQMGILPSEALMPTYSTFKEHYSVQQRSGHSAHFGRNYEDMARLNR